MMLDVKFPPMNSVGAEYSGRGRIRPKTAPARLPDFKKTIALAFLKATYPQIPY
jgi:hypothetical protein